MQNKAAAGSQKMKSSGDRGTLPFSRSLCGLSQNRAAIRLHPYRKNCNILVKTGHLKPHQRVRSQITAFFGEL
jgi:hypothetical protein